jgi:NAD-dependent deacetylase
MIFMNAPAQLVIHMHGELLKARCTDCEGVNPWRKDLGLQDQCPVCGRMGGLRPHVVWFGEMPLQMKAIYAALKGADLFVAIGTSGAVYPAARFAAQTRTFGIGTLEINLEPSDNANQFGERRYGRASEMVPVWVSEVLPSLDVAIIIPTGTWRSSFRPGDSESMTSVLCEDTAILGTASAVVGVMTPH